MRRCSYIVSAYVAVLGALLSLSSLAQDGEPVKAGVPSGQQLYAPAAEESFDFIIFGDRTTGPHEGLEVLKDAVAMANTLDPDLVMTVGDLVQGYNAPDEWLAQMREYKQYMSELKMPWYPVPGNHDVYARPHRVGGNTDLYSAHFGPLYYSFDYRWAHFIVLFSDEALSFQDPPKNQNFSPEQIVWLRKDLAETSATQLFVFLHHPRWTKGYDGCNWPDVHRMFVDDGRPVTVFAGHIHTYRSDGWIDNIRYYTLATTGGERGDFRETAALHHVDFVRVRPESSTITVLPVGSIHDGDFVLGSEVDEMIALVRGDSLKVSGQAEIALERGRTSELAVELANPTGRPVSSQLVLRMGDGWVAEYSSDEQVQATARWHSAEGWSSVVEGEERELAAGQTVPLKLRLTAPALADSKDPRVEVVAKLQYRLESGLVQPIEKVVALPLRAMLPADETAADPDHNGVLLLDGSSAVRLDVPETLSRYTLECWVKGEAPEHDAGLVAKTQGSAYGLFWSAPSEGHKLATGFVGTRDGYVKVAADKPWDFERWTHLALVFDGENAALYVDGQPRAEAKTKAAATHNALPLYVGADPDGIGRPSRFFTGAVDEVRLSSTARYSGAFAPAKTLAADGDTIVLLHFDRVVGQVHPDDSGTGHHGWAVGSPRLEHTAR